MKKAIMLLMLIVFISYAGLSGAAEGKDEYTAQDKFARAIFNIITFPFELPIAIYKTSVEENIVAGAVYGTSLGVAKGALRLFSGLVEFATFPVPPYEPMMEPEYILLQKK